VLLEHQSERDPWMALRLLGYMTRLWEDQRREQGAPLHPILPVVLYHGDEPWTAGTRLGDLFELPPELFEVVAEHSPEFRFVVDDLGRQDDVALRARALTELASVALLLLRDGRKIDDLSAFLGPWLDTFRAVAAAPDGLNAMLAVIRYVSRVTQADRLQIQTFARQIGPIAESATMTAAEEIAKEAEARGLERGRKQGRRELLVKQVTLRFAPLDEAALRLLEGATSEQMSQCAELVLTATTLDELLAPCR
jgi:hypothetical protein